VSVTCDRSTSALSFFIYLTVAETSEQADRQYREHVRRCRHPLIIAAGLRIVRDGGLARCWPFGRPDLS
jgi:hypothetical protein